MSDISASQLYSLLQTQIPRQNSTPIPAEILTIRDDNVVLNTPRGEVEIPRQTLPPAQPPLQQGDTVILRYDERSVTVTLPDLAQIVRGSGTPVDVGLGQVLEPVASTPQPLPSAFTAALEIISENQAQDLLQNALPFSGKIIETKQIELYIKNPVLAANSPLNFSLTGKTLAPPTVSALPANSEAVPSPLAKILIQPARILSPVIQAETQLATTIESRFAAPIMQPLDLRLKTPNTIIKTDQNQFNQFVKNALQAIHIKYTNLNIKSGESAAILAARTAEGDGLFQLHSADPILTPSNQPPLYGLLKLDLGSTPEGTSFTLTPTLRSGTHKNAQSTRGTPLPELSALPAHLSAIPTLAPFFLQPESQWSVLHDIFETSSYVLQQPTAQISGQIPSTRNLAQIAPALLLFIAAARGGELPQWLGERTLDALNRSGRGDLISRLNSEGQALQRLSGETSGDWRSMPVPLYHEGQIQKVILHSRSGDDGAQGSDTKSDGMTRFLFDLSMEAMGAVQLDGLFHAPKSTKCEGKLDLILRTQEPLSPPMREAMRRLYARGLEQACVTGELGFQDGTDRWVRPLDEAPN